MLARLTLPLPERAQRRTRAARRGHRIDLRATLRGMTGASRDLAPLAYRARVKRPPPLVVLCDISGSMDRYARMLLHFLHAITNDRHRVSTLVFGTRLTNITRALRHRDPDLALPGRHRRLPPLGVGPAFQPGPLGLGEQQMAGDERVAGLWRARAGEAVHRDQDGCGPFLDLSDLLGCPPGYRPFGPVGWPTWWQARHWTNTFSPAAASWASTAM